jgi:hypothetical protein
VDSQCRRALSATKAAQLYFEGHTAGKYSVEGTGDLLLPLQKGFAQHKKLEWINLEGCGYEREFVSNIHFDTEAVNLALGIESPDSGDEDGGDAAYESDTASIGGQVFDGGGTESGTTLFEDSQVQTIRDKSLQVDVLIREDTGGVVTYEQRKAWESYLLGRIQ